MIKKIIKVIIPCVLVLLMGVLVGKVFIFNDDEPTTKVSISKVISEKTLIPCGNSIGIKMDVKGALIVGLEEIESEDKISSPALDAGLQVGDRVLSIDDNEVSCADDIEKIVSNNSKDLKIKYERKGDVKTSLIRPIKSIDDSHYKLGIWVKEKIAGIGTMTFYDPEYDQFMCLGHGIYEHETGALLEVGKGQVFSTTVNSVKTGKVGNPGEIIGIFCNESVPIGQMKENSRYGVLAKSLQGFRNIDKGNEMVVAGKDQIKTGDAYILTTVDGQRVQKFDIKILEIDKKTDDGTKGIEYEVTDKALLDKCGGIVQGMSGSPIIQNGRIIGAITHVLVNDPTRGYGIFIENMLDLER